MLRQACIASIIGITVAGNSTNAGILYSVTDLGVFPGGTQSNAYGINNNGQVVGVTDRLPGQNPQAFTFTGSGPMKDIGALGGTGGGSDAFGVNSNGYVVGSSATPDNLHNHAFLFDGTTMHDLGAIDGGNSTAFGINTAGQVVGFSSVTGSSEHAFLYSGGGMQDLGTLGGNTSVAFGINTAGNVVGESARSDGYVHAFLWTNGTMTDLGTLGGSQSSAAAINDSGQAAGWSITAAGGFEHAALFEGGQVHDLGALGDPTGTGPFSSSDARGINAEGDVVGVSRTADLRDLHAFIYTAGQMLDLNSLLVNGAGWDLNEAHSINDRGQIVGLGTVLVDGEYRHDAFLLTPVPEPQSAVLWGLLAGCLALYRRVRCWRAASRFCG